MINKSNEQLMHLFVFHACINEMQGSRSKKKTDVFMFMYLYNLRINF
jgi:hypothetical protein